MGLIEELYNRELYYVLTLESGLVALFRLLLIVQLSPN